MLEEQETLEQRQYVLEVDLDDGDTITADAGADGAAARAQMATLNARLASDEFVLLGENTVVRCGNVRLVRLNERDPSGPGCSTRSNHD
jgi:hypothetical protein